jgi:hypothetical protein
MGIRARRGNNIKGLETSAEYKTQAAFAVEHSSDFTFFKKSNEVANI